MACSLSPISQRSCDDITGATYKALTVMQPFARFIQTGQKTLEIRSWATSYRGPLLIHAGMKPHKGQVLLGAKHGYAIGSAQLIARANPKDHLLGRLLCLVDLVNVRPMTKEDEQAAMVEFQEGLFAWELANVRLIKPVAMKGQLGIYNVPDKLVKIV